jgi:hypothetical protein
LRRRNLAALELGRTLVNTDGIWRIVIPANETKTHEPEDRLFPSVLLPHLEAYLAVHRPYLAGLTGRWHKPAGNALWILTDGSAMTEMALYDRIRLVARERLGVALNPHIFRGIVATTLAIEDPEHILAAAPVLGRRDFQRAQLHDLRARRRQAHREFVEVMGKRGDASRILSDQGGRSHVRFSPKQTVL